MNRIDRLSAILIMLQSSSLVKAKDIATRFDIGLRTVYRDVKALEDAGIPLAGNSGTGYSLVEGFKLPPLMFTKEEAFAFLLAEKLVDQFTDFGFKENYKSGIDKIRAVMQLAEKKSIEMLNDKIDVMHFHAVKPTANQDILKDVLCGIADKRRIQITYSNYKQEITERKLDPIGLFFSKSNWYLVAYCDIRKDYRTFRVGRIQCVYQTSETFENEHPPLHSFLKEIEKMEGLHEVLIEVDKTKVILLDENRFYEGLIYEEDKGDKVILHFMVFSLERFARWCLSYIDIARILSPDALKGEVTSLLNKGNKY
nr:YafY family protein [uncultured Bacteroides sp.]